MSVDWDWVIYFLTAVVLTEAMVALVDISAPPVFWLIIKWALCPLWGPVVLIVHHQDRQVAARRRAVKVNAWLRAELAYHAEHQHLRLVRGYVEANEHLIKAGIYGRHQPVDLDDQKVIDKIARELGAA